MVGDSASRRVYSSDSIPKSPELDTPIPAEPFPADREPFFWGGSDLLGLGSMFVVFGDYVGWALKTWAQREAARKEVKG